MIRARAGHVAETLIVVLLVVVLVAGGAAAVSLSWQTVAFAGVACLAAGAVLGIPTGFYYHVKLHALLAPRGLLPRRWWVSPVRYHRHLDPAQRPQVMRWFYAGGVGFVLMMLGCAITFFGVLLSR